MPVCVIVENPTLSDAEAETLMGHVRAGGPVPPEGARLLLAGPSAPEAGWRYISVWESPEDFQRFFAERIAPAYGAAGLDIAPLTRKVFDVQMLVAGDLVGAA
jgi:hypothetical protein